MRPEVLLHRLEQEQARLAKEAMERASPDPFAHGRAVGVYVGIGMAREVLIAMLGEDDERRNKF